MALLSFSVSKSALLFNAAPTAHMKPGGLKSFTFNRALSSGSSQLFGPKIRITPARFMPTTIQSKRMIVYAVKVSKGSVPPSFNLKDQDDRMVSLSNFKGKAVVVYFYPGDETPGCTKEACAFRDSYEKFEKAGAEVVGISVDGPESHKAFAKKYKLPFALLSDEGNKVRQEWGVPGDLLGTLPGRETYVIDEKGVVQLVYNNQLQPETHVEETLKVLQTL